MKNKQELPYVPLTHTQNIKLDEFLPFCIIWALEQPDSSTKPSEQYTIGYPDTWAFPSTKFESSTEKYQKRNLY